MNTGFLTKMVPITGFSPSGAQPFSTGSSRHSSARSPRIFSAYYKKTIPPAAKNRSAPFQPLHPPKKVLYFTKKQKRCRYVRFRYPRPPRGNRGDQMGYPLFRLWKRLRPPLLGGRLRLYVPAGGDGGPAGRGRPLYLRLHRPDRGVQGGRCRMDPRPPRVGDRHELDPALHRHCLGAFQHRPVLHRPGGQGAHPDAGLRPLWKCGEDLRPDAGGEPAPVRRKSALQHGF